MRVLQTRPRNFDLFSFSEGLLKETGLIERATLESGATRRTSANQPMVTLRLSGINLRELIDFLHKVYASGNAVVVYDLDRVQTRPKWPRPGMHHETYDGPGIESAPNADGGKAVHCRSVVYRHGTLHLAGFRRRKCIGDNSG